ncbi:MAG: hypothetical protein AAF908_11165, partial [Pseudomonadota bacterium]
YEVDLTYFDNFGGQELRLEIDDAPVDQSAFYKSVNDFLNNAGGGELVPVADYHPSYFLGEHILDGDDTIDGTSQSDKILGEAGDDTINGRGGADHLEGGYGDDRLDGGRDDDVLDGGRGSDLLIGGHGDDVLISRSDVGEPKIGQLVEGNATRGDPDNEVGFRLKLKGYEDQEFVGDDILVGGQGRDTFLIEGLLNAKDEIIQKHVRSDGTINWQGVAGENDELHDHWVDGWGIDIIADYNKNEDTIAIIGHTAARFEIEHVNVDNDAQLETVINVFSQQHGGGGAHTRDLMGTLIVHGDLVERDDLVTDAGVFHGIVDNVSEIAEALQPQGDPKVTTVGNTTFRSYDSRLGNNGEGPILSEPWKYAENPYADEVTFARQSGEVFNNTKGNLTQLGIEEIDGVTIGGTDGYDVILPPIGEAQEGLPGALGFWRFDEADGSQSDARGGPEAIIYRLDENRPILQDNPQRTTGPRGESNSAIVLNGEDDFVFIQHSVEYEISQGTIALWVRPDDLSDDAIIISKDQSGADDGGHFRLGHTEEGRVYIRFAEGDGGSNKSWETSASYLTE